jgi:release factor glutamine methyltransferase
MTVIEAGKNITEKLKAIYTTGEAEAMSNLVIESITGKSIPTKTADLRAVISSSQIEQINLLILRLLQHEPVQYVLHEAWFCGLKLFVDKNVLIPRPETEELVEWIISDCKFPVNELKILDIGTGSGCIAIALKKRLKKAAVWACDISSAALAVAKKNAETLSIEINFIELDFFNEEQRNTLPNFDIIVSNPPYVPEKDKAQMHANVLHYEPATALFVPDNNPLIFYNAIAAFAKKKLSESGKIYCEIHENLGEACLQLFLTEGFTAELKKDMQEKDRMVKAGLLVN